MTEVEIKEGPELDLAVALAVGDEPGLPFSIARAERGEEGFTYKQYSADLNAAFAAAEQVGLFEDGSYSCLLRSRATPSGNQWQVCRDIHHKFIVVGAGESPALAICAAILKLKLKGKQPHETTTRH